MINISLEGGSRCHLQMLFQPNRIISQFGNFLKNSLKQQTFRVEKIRAKILSVHVLTSEAGSTFMVEGGGGRRSPRWR